jgi:hypothetical protein
VFGVGHSQAQRYLPAGEQTIEQPAKTAGPGTLTGEYTLDGGEDTGSLITTTTHAQEIILRDFIFQIFDDPKSTHVSPPSRIVTDLNESTSHAIGHNRPTVSKNARIMFRRLTGSVTL